MEKSFEYWAAGLGALIFILNQSPEKDLKTRWLTAVSSILLGMGSSQSLSELTGFSIELMFALVAILGYGILDVAVSILRDREFLKSILQILAARGKK